MTGEISSRVERKLYTVVYESNVLESYVFSESAVADVTSAQTGCSRCHVTSQNVSGIHHSSARSRVLREKLYVNLNYDVFLVWP